MTLPVKEEVEKLFSDLHVAIERGRPREASEISDKLEVLTMAHILPDPGIDWQAEYGLTRKESRIAAYLYSKLGKTAYKRPIYSDCYSDADGPDEKIIDIFICKIRKKLANSPFTIETVWGVGYRMKEAISVTEVNETPDELKRVA